MAGLLCLSRSYAASSDSSSLSITYARATEADREIPALLHNYHQNRKVLHVIWSLTLFVLSLCIYTVNGIHTVECMVVVYCVVSLPVH